jgi:hypothetical protein
MHIADKSIMILARNLLIYLAVFQAQGIRRGVADEGEADHQSAMRPGVACGFRILHPMCDNGSLCDEVEGAINNLRPWSTDPPQFKSIRVRF